MDSLKKFLLSIAVLLVSACLLHLYFFVSDSWFTPRGADASKQFLFFKYFLSEQFTSGNFFWSWQYGLGGDLWGQFNYYYSASPFFWLLLLFPVTSLIDVLDYQLLFSILRLWSGLIFMYMLLRYLKRSSTSSIIGSLIYGGSVFVGLYLLRVDYMAEAFMWLPLLILGYERLMKEKKILLFVVAMVIVIASNFYFAFITSVFINIYAVFFYLLNKELRFSISDLVRNHCKLIYYYVLAFGLAAFAFLPAVYAFLGADRFYQEYHVPLIFNFQYYSTAFYNMFYPSESMTLLHLSVPVIVFVLLIGSVTLFKLCKSARIHLYFLAFMLLLYVLPFSYSLFNGLSAMQPRWLYLLLFTFSLVLSKVIDIWWDHLRYEKILNKKILIVSFSVWGISLICKPLFYNSFFRSEDLMITFIFALTGVLFLFINRINRRIFSTLLITLTVINISYVNAHFYTMNLGSAADQKDLNSTYFTSAGYEKEIEKELIKKIQEADDEFYRTSFQNELEYNTPMYYGHKGFSAYHSLIPENLHQLFKEDLNILQFDSPSLYHGFDNRQFPETALGNRYYVIPDTHVYVPYGYTKIMEYEGYSVYENQFALPAGYMHQKYMTTEEFNSLNPAQKDQAFLSTAIIAEDDLEYISGMTQADPDIYRSEVLHEGMDQNVDFYNIEVKNGRYIAADNAAFEILMPPPKDDGELLVELTITSLTGESFSLNINGKTLNKRPNDYKYAYPKEQFVFKVNNDQLVDKFRFKLSPGEYEIQDLKIYHHSYQFYEETIQNKLNNSMEDISYSDRSFSGKIEADQKGLLFLPIPYHEGWSLKINGEKADMIETQHAFIGVPLEKGNHEVELQYRTPYLLEGSAVTAISFIILLLELFRQRKINRK
ncbi:YfhO family protein [Jeotgalibacillus sp. R-1-5s-1]|uniref:YfhO family protein n=1 Tax=Jeotgalibacillus sp. R-1-5s-1 TaxID=2555897 RepID=UPI001FC7D718|nr:YfhO family protein [Jeotgalibacillus sp. R-1-5s-1]